MLKLKPTCETCGKALPGDSTDAWICSFECTFCGDCVETKHEEGCPNCGGVLERRPARTAALLKKFPAATNEA